MQSRNITPLYYSISESGTEITHPGLDCFISSYGDDKNNGRTEATPVRTLRRAVEVVAEGGHIYFIGNTWWDTTVAERDEGTRLLKQKFRKG